MFYIEHQNDFSMHLGRKECIKNTSEYNGLSNPNTPTLTLTSE